MKTNSMLQSKSILATRILAVVFMLFLLSCKDDKDNGPSNYISVDGSKKALKASVFIFDTNPNDSPVTGEDYYRHELVLFSDGLSIDDLNNNRITGTGHAVDLLINGGAMDLEAGTYTFTGTEEDAQPFELWDAAVYINYTTSTEEGEVYVFGAGQLKIARTGETYTVEAEGTVYPPVEVGNWGPDLTKPSKSVKIYYKGLVSKYADQ